MARHINRLKPLVVCIYLVLLNIAIGNSAEAEILDNIIQRSPTKLSCSLLRGGAGRFGANRGNGATHKGIDIVANQSSLDKSVYQVRAVAPGTVAYCRVNGGEDSGYGYTVVIDHGNGYYTQYSHLAINVSSELVRQGASVKTGQIIGYLADLQNQEKSSGNVRDDVVKPYDKVQLHFEVFTAPTGRRSSAALSTLKSGGTILDPTARLTGLGYQSF